ncbi:MAG: 3-hydroxyacyl-CoA dehydrogenase NAD-binding domain-containing protein [Syntrophales bacterium]
MRQKTLGVIGLGSMGNGTAISALRRGMPARALDLNPDAARKLALPLPMVSAAHQLSLGTAAASRKPEDDSAGIKLSAALTGITLPASAAPKEAE